VAELRRRIDAGKLGCELEVDGGVDERTAPRLAAAGATVLVAGTSVFAHPEGPEAAVRRLALS
jgi:ribulose-phosphate 3-epimerase